MRREVPVEEAIGLALAHDLTRIVPGEFKGRAFAKGHIIQPEDVPLLLDIGKRYIYVLEVEENEIHEDEAAGAMADALAGSGILKTTVHEGKVVLKAAHTGMLWVDARRVLTMNLIDDISITTRMPFTHVTKGTAVAGVRPIPLILSRDKLTAIQIIAEESLEQSGAVIDVIPYAPQTVHVITTGSEIQSGRIKDKAGPVLEAKLRDHGFELANQVFVGDDLNEVSEAIETACKAGATMVVVTGGMSVDPDDRSPAAIRKVATSVVTYGVPVLPGSMLMLAYRDQTAIFGLPGAIIFDKVTSFDVLLPRVLANLAVTKADIAQLGVGGWLNL